MANPEHLRIIAQGVAAWNEWSRSHPRLEQHKSNDEENLEITDLDRDIRVLRADLSNANLRYSDLKGIDLSMVDLRSADLGSANLNDANIAHANLTDAFMYGARFSQANLRGTILDGTDMRRAMLFDANLSNAYITNANLSRSVMNDVNLTDASLLRTDFTDATIVNVIFGSNDLSELIGLDTVRHLGPSVIGLDTVYRSKGLIPEAFLRGAGIPENFITYMASLTRKAFDFYSCFISHSSKDQTFAERLYADLQTKGVRCWYAPEDLKIGEKLRVGIDESIRKHDKLLLVLSSNSINSDWVEQEVETALTKEKQQKRPVLFPIRLDDAVMQINTGWPALIRNTRNIGDFKGWKNYDAYKKAFERLLRDLRAGNHSQIPSKP